MAAKPFQSMYLQMVSTSIGGGLGLTPTTICVASTALQTTPARASVTKPNFLKRKLSTENEIILHFKNTQNKMHKARMI